MLTQVFDALAGKRRQRTMTSHQAIESAAKAIAAGQAADVAALEADLHTTGMTIDQFRELCEQFETRAKQFASLDRLAGARRKADKINAEIEAATAAHAEATAAYQKRVAKLQGDAAEANVLVNQGERARDWLLDLANAPPTLRDEYQAALEGEQAASEQVGAAEREVRRLTDEIKSERGWLEQLAGEDAKELHPAETSITASGRGRMSAARGEKFDEHARRCKRLEARLVEANQTLDEARAALVKAEAAVAGIRKKLLAA